MTVRPGEGGTTESTSSRQGLLDEIERLAKRYDDEMIAFRRDLHRHPELGGHETRTTSRIGARLEQAGLSWKRVDSGTGLFADVDGSQPVSGVLPTVAVRADIDALPLQDPKIVPYHSTVEGVTHACGHDAHAAAVLGAGLILTELAAEGLLPGRVRLIFQPAEEKMPGGAEDVIASGGLDGVGRIFALHCDPNEEVGRVGLRVGGLTASADQLTVTVTGPGGHTARPHLTLDLVYALSELAVMLPGVASRTFDPRSGISLVWGKIAAGSAANVVPQRGELAGTVRSLDVATWEAAATTIPQLARQILAPLGVEPEIVYLRGVPPVVNDAVSVAILDRAVRDLLGDDAVAQLRQSLGGEDFAWYLESVPGAMFRLGVRPTVTETVGDLHRASFDIDERAIGVGTRVLVLAALDALDHLNDQLADQRAEQLVDQLAGRLAGQLVDRLAGQPAIAAPGE